MFGYLNLDRSPSRDWYCELLSLSLTDTNKSIHINTRNCVGTVLSLCSLKKYFCMYHAKHPESSRHVSTNLLQYNSNLISRLLGYSKNVHNIR